MAKTITKTEGNPYTPRILDLKNTTLFFKKIKIKECRFCSTPFNPLPLMYHYEHDSGFIVPGFSKRQWLYLRCRKCGHDWSLTHLGVSQKETTIIFEHYNDLNKDNFIGTKWDLQMQVKHEQDKIWEIQDVIQTRLMELAQNDPYWDIDLIPEEMEKRMPEIDSLNKILEIIKRK